MQMNKIILSLLLSLLVQIPVSYAKEYSDLDKNSFYYKAVETFTAEGILEGYPDGSFKPNQPINRAEALKVILKTFNKDAAELPAEKFPDVNEGDWFYDFVRQGLKHKIIEGYVDGTFKPGNQVLYSESLKMGLVGKGIDVSEVSFAEFHPSVKAEDWFAKHFVYANNLGMIELEANGALNPNKAYTRGEFVDLIFKIRSISAEGTFDISYNWKEETNNSGLKLSYPFDWQSFELGEGLFLAHFAGQNPTFIKNIPNGARISINFWQNPEQKSAATYFEEIKAKYVSEKGSEVEFSEDSSGQPILIASAVSFGVLDFYMYMNDGTILLAEGSFDQNSVKKDELYREILKIYEKIQFGGQLTLSASQKLELVRKNILVTGKGKETLDVFNQIELFETDTLGVGTGPVDYYYVPGINTTIKYERTSDLILDLKTGKTSAF